MFERSHTFTESLSENEKRREAKDAPVQTLQQLDLLRCQLARLLVRIAERLHRADFALATATDTRARAFNTFLDPVALDTACIELCVRTPHMIRVFVLSFRAYDDGMLALSRTEMGGGAPWGRGR